MGVGVTSQVFRPSVGSAEKTLSVGVASCQTLEERMGSPQKRSRKVSFDLSESECGTHLLRFGPFLSQDSQTEGFVRGLSLVGVFVEVRIRGVGPI